jgi:ABC-type uncharacterized transport system permease subunit
VRRAVALFPAWKEIARIAARSVHAYRFDSLTWLGWQALQLFLLRAIWLAIYDGQGSLDGISAETQIVFITITTLQAILLSVDLAWIIQGQVTTGQVALNLIRPLGFIPQMLAQQTGRTAGYIPYLALLVPVALLIGSLRMPDPNNIFPYVISLFLAYVVSVLTWLLVGMLAFWIMHVNAVRAMLGLSSQFLGGALIPLWFMPDSLRFVLELLPFQAMIFLPASIYTGEVTGTELIRPFAVQLVWVALLWVSATVMWRRAQQRIVIQGG